MKVNLSEITFLKTQIYNPQINPLINPLSSSKWAIAARFQASIVNFEPKQKMLSNTCIKACYLKPFVYKWPPFINKIVEQAVKGVHSRS